MEWREGRPSFCWSFLLGTDAFQEGRCVPECRISEAAPGHPGTPLFLGTHAPQTHCRQHTSHGGGAGNGRSTEASLKGTHTQRHSILPSAPSFPANLGALASLLLLGFPLG